MKVFGKRRRLAHPAYDKTGKIPVIRSSICTGEQVAGFKDAASGRFEELMLLRSDADLQDFLRLYDIAESDIRREW